MKAIYLKPTTEIFAVTTTPLLLGSKVEKGFDPDEAPETPETGGNLGRRRTVWDDEEEEE